MRGIILAGGTGSRLWPITIAVSKQLLPVYNKPLIFYPLSTLMLGGIREFLLITTPEDQAMFQRALGDGANLGIKIQYAVQHRPEGLAQALIIGEEFIGSENVALILGDNLFHGPGLGEQIKSLHNLNGAHLFGYRVSDPTGYGVAEIDKSGSIKSIEEKPQNPKSNIAVTGLYLYDSSSVELAKKISPSLRGELEISTLNQMYLHLHKLQLSMLGRGTTWFDAGTLDSLSSAAAYVKIVEERQGVQIGCIEEVAWRNGWIDDHQLKNIGLGYGSSPYSYYLRSLAEGEPNL